MSVISFLGKAYLPLLVGGWGHLMDVDYHIGFVCCGLRVDATLAETVGSCQNVMVLDLAMSSSRQAIHHQTTPTSRRQVFQFPNHDGYRQLDREQADADGQRQCLHLGLAAFHYGMCDTAMAVLLALYLKSYSFKYAMVVAIVVSADGKKVTQCSSGQSLMSVLII